MHLDEVKKIHQQGKLDEAKSGYQAILKAEPDNADALHYYAVLLAEEGNFSAAREYMGKAIELVPTNFSLQLNLANIYKAEGMLDEAEQLLQKVIHLSPRYPAAYNNLGTIYFSQEKWQAAIDAYQQAIDIQPDYADAYYNLGLAYIRAQQRREAMNVFDALLALAPMHPGARFQRACLIMQQGNYMLAIEQFLRIAESFPHHFETQTNLANGYLKMGELGKAKQHALLALELVADDAQVLFNLGVISMQQGQVQEAIDYYLKCLKVAPDNVEAHTNLGAAYLTAKNTDAAILHLSEVVRLRPEDEAIKHTLAIISGKQPMTAAPTGYIQLLFDSYADHYDKHVREALHYQVPELLQRLVQDAGVVKNKSLAILDLGCGTGLCGEQFACYAKTMTGVDLSANMLELAASRHCYTTLVKSDLMEFLTKTKETYDLIIAGDTIVYLADLTELFAKIHDHLNVNGMFAFNTEKSFEKNIVPVSGRFAHHPDYVVRAAKEKSLNLLFSKEVILRQQDEKSVDGVLYLLYNIQRYGKFLR